MKIRMLIGTGGPNGSACDVGEVYDLPDGLARTWVAAGRAVPADDQPPPPDDQPPPHDGVVTINGDPMVETRPVKRLRTR
jgi:hypothetical protein